MSGRSSSRCSDLAASEDRPRAIGYRAWVAGGVHGQSAARAQRPPRREHRLGLLRKRHHLVVAEPEPNAGRLIVRRALLADRDLAGDQDKHAPRLVVAEPHLCHLPLRLTRYEAGGGTGMFRRRDALRLHHLVQPDEQPVTLRLPAGGGQLAPGAGGQEEELALARLADGGHGDVLHWVKLEDRHGKSLEARPGAPCREIAGARWPQSG